MDISKTLKFLKGRDGASASLGFTFSSTPDPLTLSGRAEADLRTCQPFGYLSGGVALALAETLAGIGSITLCPGRPCPGMQVSANHLLPVKMGDNITAEARIIHKGRQHHVWQVEIRRSDGEISSIVTVTNFIGREIKEDYEE